MVMVVGLHARAFDPEVLHHEMKDDKDDQRQDNDLEGLTNC